MSEPIKIRFGEGETGWALPITESIAKIDNIPTVNGLNIGDIVELEYEGDGLPVVGHVLYNQFSAKVAIYYQETHQFHTLTLLLRALNCQTEGWLGPKSDAPGIMIVAYHPERVDPVKLAEAVMIPQADDKKEEGDPYE
jgi:hypothetical protein